MQKLDPNTDGKTMDIVADNIAKLKVLFPEIVTEGKIDFEALKEVLGEYVEDREERYSFTWNGKSKARMLAQTPSNGTLRPCVEESVDFDSTQNLFIEGDNLEVLKLLQKSYYGKIKMIYIDPPYNTGKDFVYPDNFRDSIKRYLELTSQVDEFSNKIAVNTETNGRYHTDWLSMMYPRLKLARNLLCEDGSIFISIDDIEVSNLRKICDEIFGEENFVANIVWQKKYAVSNDDPGIAAMHDHILVYRKGDEFQRNLLPRTEKQLSRYKNLDDDPRGLWSSDNYVSNKSKDERPTLWYPIIHPKDGREVWPDESAVWRYSKEKHETMVKENRLYWGPDQSYEKPRLKRFLSEIQEGVVPSTWWPFVDVGHNDEGQKETARLIGKKVFSTPKPVRLLKHICAISTGKDDTVLDFFAGSCAMGHAVIELNSEDGNSRKYIMVQLPESCATNTEAHSKGLMTIADIGKERLKKSIDSIRERMSKVEEQSKAQLPGLTEEPPQLDLGFKVFKLDSTNIKPWDADFDNYESSMDKHIINIKPDRSEEDVLYEILLKYGLDLTLPIEERTIADKKVFVVGLGALVLCLADGITLDVVEGIADLKEEFKPEIMRVVFKDNGFSGPDGDVVKTNTIQILRQHGITDVKSL